MAPSSQTSPRQRRPGRRAAFAFALLVGSPLVALGVPETVRIPIVRDHGQGNPPDPARFSHWAHDTFSCVACHTSIFPQRKLGFTHADMAEGRYCGSCHDGRTAFGPKDKGVECETCHVPRTKKEIDENDLWGSRAPETGLDWYASPMTPTSFGPHGSSEVRP
ncbi:MAG: c(7)-type cytochrome triheme domain-containing protein [Myxococcota bacterium]